MFIMAPLNLRQILLFILLATIFAFVSSDFSKDKAECHDQLITMSSCLNYVAGDAKSPAPKCCAVVQVKVNVSKKCLCILVKDRNEPELGLKLNATRALALPSLCHSPSSSLDCIPLLGLDPKSPAAQIFIESANATQVARTSPSSSDGGKQHLRNMGVIYFIYLCLFMVYFQFMKL